MVSEEMQIIQLNKPTGIFQMGDQTGFCHGFTKIAE